MLNIHIGRENLDKDKFMFAQIKERIERGKRVILIVPDQFTLEAEKNAFAYLEVDGLMDLEVLSFSRLANRVFGEVGGGLKTFINNYGKYMMISRVLLEQNPNLKVFNDLEGSSDFVEKINNFISQLKNHNITPEFLGKILDGEEDDSLLSRKLEDINEVYKSYEAKMGEDQIDTADYLGMFVSKISESSLIRTSEFWVSGFDYLTPRNMDALLEIAKTSGFMNVVLTAEMNNLFFKSTNNLASELRGMALDSGLDSKIIQIGSEYERDKSGREQIAYLEEQFCKSSPKPCDISSVNIESKDQIRLVSAANYYAEAETVAVEITKLIREKNMRYRDILVICNDMDARASVIKRVFSEYGLPIFVDQRRGIHHNPVLEFITALLDITADGWLPDLIFKLLKTGLTELTTDEVEELENYAIKFKIIGGKWKKPFKLTLDGYSDTDLSNLNETREKVVSIISGFETGFKKHKSAKDRTSELFRYLSEEINLENKINEYASRLREENFLDYAEEMDQIWPTTLGIFDQLVGILNDEELTNDEFATILKTGLESVQIGMLPTSIDQILFGTMQRTRSGEVKALFVLGANDGILPAYSGEETLLNEEERDVLYDKGNVICKSDTQIMDEEQMAIYRNFSKPLKHLFVSYSVSDTEGNEQTPSIIFKKLRSIFPDIEVEKDILNRDCDHMDLVQGRDSTINHLTDVMRNSASDDWLSDLWKGVYKWYEENSPALVNNIIEGLSFRNNREKIDENYIVDLYKRSYKDAEDKVTSSPSAIENFSRCPFSFFMSRGIRLKERRIYELDSRDVGDIYHETLMRFGQSMSEDGHKPMDPESAWNKKSDEECTEIIEKIYDDVEDQFKAGLFKESKYEEYRGARFKKIVTDVALEIKDQVSKGQISDMFFESRFENGGDFAPITITNEGKTIDVTGKIDRVDVLDGGYAKIVDYKSGADELNVDDVMSGWQLQLMIYLKAVTESNIKNAELSSGEPLKPAGVFYFNIPEPHINTGEIPPEKIESKVSDSIADAYTMNGMVINDRSVIESITGSLDKKNSKVIPVRLNKDGELTGKSVVSKEDFDAITSSVSELIDRLCSDMLAGDVKARPKKSKTKDINGNEKTACTYCNYRGICSFDESFDR